MLDLCEAVLLFRCREDLRVDSMWDRYEHSPLQQDTSVCVLQVVVNIIGRWCVKPAVLVGTLKATSQRNTPTSEEEDLMEVRVDKALKIKDSSSDNLQGIQKKLHQLLGTCEIPDRSLSLVSIPYVRSSGASEAVNMSPSPAVQAAVGVRNTSTDLSIKLMFWVQGPSPPKLSVWLQAESQTGQRAMAHTPNTCRSAVPGTINTYNSSNVSSGCD
ncbi:hypothetical protein NQZ68_025024 [Dissostichus eleginoides]|nr:hypothetical protein NQZ68_025024 [Dissostichus eleginoides]